LNAREWVEESRAQILSEGAEFKPFGSPEDELKELHLELTYACNLRCRMCDIWGRYAKDHTLPRRELTVQQILGHIAQSSLLARVRLVIVSGGEPFLKPGFSDLVAGVIEMLPATVGILTNLYNTGLIKSRLSEIKTRSGLDKIWLGTSLDGLEAAHNNTRGADDAFARFNLTLGMIRDQYPEIPVTANYTLTSDNYRDIYETYQFCRERRVSMSVQFPVSWPDAESFVFDASAMAEIERQLLLVIEDEAKDFETGRISRHTMLAKTFYISGLLDYQRDPRRVFRKCVAGRRFAVFSPEGHVYVCPILKNATIGSLSDQPFDRIWAGAEAESLRRRIDAGNCHCWLNCTIFPNADEALSCRRVRSATDQSTR
jgi:radical SAM protein with 4Fe4S-binding SPASM domain